MNRPLSPHFKKNLRPQQEGLQPSRQHPNKDSALREALLSYYGTTQVWDFSPPLFRVGWDEGVETVFQETGRWSNEYMTKYYSSIVLMHLFVEHLLSEILVSVHPALAYVSIKPEWSPNICSDRLSSHDPSQVKTINYSHKIVNVSWLLEGHNLPEGVRIPDEYRFLKQHLDMMVDLGHIRNETVHLGEKTLTDYFYELLWVNGILPFIADYLGVVQNRIWLERNTYCGKRVLEELVALKLPTVWNDKQQVAELNTRLRHVYHLKELGRASFIHEIYLNEEQYPQKMRAMIRKNYTIPNRRKAEDVAKVKLLEYGNYKRYICPCCGARALISHSIWYNYARQANHVTECRCYSCTYQVKERLGEPSQFGILTQKVLLDVPDGYFYKRGLKPKPENFLIRE